MTDPVAGSKQSTILEGVRTGLTQARSEGKRLGPAPLSPDVRERSQEALKAAAASSRPGLNSERAPRLCKRHRPGIESMLHGPEVPPHVVPLAKRSRTVGLALASAATR